MSLFLVFDFLMMDIKDSSVAPTQVQIATPVVAPATAPKKVLEVPSFDRRNWLIHRHYVHKHLDTCSQLIKVTLDETNGMCEYALHIQGLLHRLNGKIHESLELFQTCCLLSPNNVSNLKQVARSYFLLGKHKAAVEIYNEAAKISERDWEVSHNQGICYMYMAATQPNFYEQAKESFKHAIKCGRHEISFAMLAKIYLMEGELELAAETYRCAVEAFPENGDLRATLGLLYLQREQYQKAFEQLGACLSGDPTHSKAILAAGSIIQKHSDFDVALSKYRISVVNCPESAPLWNNIGLCFLGKKKLVAAVTCLKRAAYFAPFNFQVLYNLGLVHLTLKQYSSSFQFLSAAASANPHSALTFMLMGMALSNLEDLRNAMSAFEQAMKLNAVDERPEVPLNFAAFLYDQGKSNEASVKFAVYNRLMTKRLAENESFQLDDEFKKLADSLEPILQVGEQMSSEK